MTQPKRNALFTFLLLSALPFAASAHTGIGDLQGFIAGFSHPWLGLDHLLAMSAIGLWAAVVGGRHLWLLPTAFLASMAAGAWLGFAGVNMIGAESWIALSVLSLGMLLTFKRDMAALPAAALAAVFALVHGYVHAAEMTGESDAWTYALGFLTATASLHGVGLTAALAGPFALKALRITFAVVCTLAGTMLLVGV